MSLKRGLQFAACSRFKFISELAWNITKPEGNVFSTTDAATTILFGGDVEFDNEYRKPPGTFYRRTADSGISRGIRRRIGRVLDRLVFAPELYSAVCDMPYMELVRYSEKDKKKSRYYKSMNAINIEYRAGASKYEYPFEKIGPFLKTKDIVMVNLETPLTARQRTSGHFRSDPQYAGAMRDAGISIVSVANNHMFDAGEPGFIDTIDHLNAAGVSFTGGAMNADIARAGRLLADKGTSFLFLGYTYVCNSNYTSIADDYPGILPMETGLMLEDVKAAKEMADLVIVSLHWGYEDQPNIHSKQTEIAHLLIDGGADCIVGHHPHVPHGIEIYKERPILYSLGNFIFAHHWKKCSDNFLAELIIEQKAVKGVKIYPISGKGEELFQPGLLKGERARSLLHELQIKSMFFNTGIAVKDDVGFIEIRQ